MLGKGTRGPLESFVSEVVVYHSSHEISVLEIHKIIKQSKVTSLNKITSVQMNICLTLSKEKTTKEKKCLTEIKQKQIKKKMPLINGESSLCQVLGVFSLHVHSIPVHVSKPIILVWLSDRTQDIHPPEEVKVCKISKLKIDSME